jgi:hypothetical protein
LAQQNGANGRRGPILNQKYLGLTSLLGTVSLLTLSYSVTIREKLIMYELIMLDISHKSRSAPKI